MNCHNNDSADAPGSIHLLSMLLPKLLGPGEPGKLHSGAHRQHRSTQSSAKLVMRREGLACGFPTTSQDHKFSFLSLLLETHDVSGLLTYSLGHS